MRLLSVAGALAVAACQPMYKAPAAKLHEPVAVDHPAAAVQPEKLAQATECTVPRSQPAKGISEAEKTQARGYVSSGDSKVDRFAKPTPNGPSDERVVLIRRAIDDYRSALTKDPYNVDATLQLARAYDLAQHKGCALVMLRRLETLSQTSSEAIQRINDVDANDSWFHDYRDEARQAIKR